MNSIELQSNETVNIPFPLGVNNLNPFCEGPIDILLLYQDMMWDRELCFSNSGIIYHIYLHTGHRP